MFLGSRTLPWEAFASWGRSNKQTKSIICLFSLCHCADSLWKWWETQLQVPERDFTTQFAMWWGSASHRCCAWRQNMMTQKRNQPPRLPIVRYAPRMWTWHVSSNGKPCIVWSHWWLSKMADLNKAATLWRGTSPDCLAKHSKAHRLVGTKPDPELRPSLNSWKWTSTGSVSIISIISICTLPSSELDLNSNPYSNADEPTAQFHVWSLPSYQVLAKWYKSLRFWAREVRSVFILSYMHEIGSLWPSWKRQNPYHIWLLPAALYWVPMS